jgi:hypothetical protein
MIAGDLVWYAPTAPGRITASVHCPICPWIARATDDTAPEVAATLARAHVEHDRDRHQLVKGERPA